MKSILCFPYSRGISPSLSLSAPLFPLKAQERVALVSCSWLWPGITPEPVVTKMHCIAVHHPGVQCLTITVNPNHLTPHFFVFVKYIFFGWVGGLGYLLLSLNLMKSFEPQKQNSLATLLALQGAPYAIVKCQEM